MKACVIIPTYNERQNLGILFLRLLKVFKEIKGYLMSVLVVDDNSSDGTEEAVCSFIKEHSDIYLLKRKNKTGLGSAYIAGFQYAINKLKPDIIFQMDGDLSHNPQDLPRFLKEINDGYDLVIGSRYIKGGRIPDWSLKRRLISRGGNFFARFIAGLPVIDCTSGFRAIKAALLEKINLDSITVQGYAFQITLLYELIRNKAKIKEIPITFYDRTYGQTKLGNKDIGEFFINTFRLRFNEK